VGAIIERIKVKFPAECNNYTLFYETENCFLLLDHNSSIKSFKQIGDGAELIFREKTWPGTSAKSARFVTGEDR